MKIVTTNPLQSLIKIIDKVSLGIAPKYDNKYYIRIKKV